MAKDGIKGATGVRGNIGDEQVGDEAARVIGGGRRGKM